VRLAWGPRIGGFLLAEGELDLRLSNSLLSLFFVLFFPLFSPVIAPTAFLSPAQRLAL